MSKESEFMLDSWGKTRGWIEMLEANNDLKAPNFVPDTWDLYPCTHVPMCPFAHFAHLPWDLICIIAGLPTKCLVRDNMLPLIVFVERWMPTLLAACRSLTSVFLWCPIKCASRFGFQVWHAGCWEVLPPHQAPISVTTRYKDPVRRLPTEKIPPSPSKICT